MTTFIISLLLFAALLVFELNRRSRIPIDAFRLTLLVCGLAYFIIPDLLPSTDVCEPYCAGIPWLPRLISIVGLVALIVGFFLSYGLPVFKTRPGVMASEKSEYCFMLIVLLLSTVALCVYAYSFGGFLSAFSYGAIARYSDGRNIEVQGSSAVGLYFVGMAYIVLIVSQYKLYQPSKYKKRYVAVLICAVIVVLAYSLINASRGAIFNVLMLTLFVHFNVRGLKVTTGKIIAILVFVGFGLLLTVYGKGVIGATASVFRNEDISTAYSGLEQREGAYVYNRLIYEFSHPIKSITAALDHDTDYNLMKHFFVAPLHLAPTRLLGLSGDKPFRITEVNTYLLTGDAEGGIPPGLVATFWYGGGVSGVLAGCLLFGVFIGWLQRQCYGLMNTNPSAVPIVLYVFFRVGWFVSNGDPSVFLKHNFHFGVFLVLLAIFRIIRRIRLRLPAGITPENRNIIRDT